MNTQTLDKILSRNPITKKYYTGCFPSDRIPECRHYPCSMVINLDDSKHRGSHWIGIFVKNATHIYYFDSYGDLPHENKHIMKFLSGFKNITRQTAVIQSVVSTACGYYVIFFIYICSLGKSLHYINSLLSKVKNPDKYVVNYVDKYIR